MAKRRITQQQAVRIKQQQERSHETGEEGLLVAHYGKYADVESKEGKIYRCNLRQNLGTAVLGDQVVWQPVTEDTGVLVALKPRRNVLARPTAPGKNKLIAANVDQMIVVMALQPRPPFSLIDSYLVATEISGLSAVLLLNKMDLMNEESDDLLKQLKLYQHLGYKVVETSVVQKKGFEDLQQVLQTHTSIFVGQSGVGKSALIAALLSAEDIRVAAANVMHSTHTTTTARLYHLPHGGDLIDSPGVREFTLWDMTSEQVAQGFIEFRDYLGKCQFRNCKHQYEKNCALKQAIEDGKITPERLESYQRIVAAASD